MNARAHALVRGFARPLPILLAITALQGICWATFTAPFQGPDENAHVAYTQNLAENGKPPQFGTGDGPESTQVGDALFYLSLRANVGLPMMRPAWSATDQRNWERIASKLQDSARENSGGPNAVAKNPPLYYLYAAVPYLASRGSGLFHWFFALRLASVLLLMATVAFAWLAAAELFPDTFRRTVATGFVALLPQLGFMGAMVNPDILLTAEWTAFAALGLRMLVRGPTFARSLGLLVLVAAAVLTQGRGLPMVPCAAVLVVLVVWRHRRTAPWRAWAGLAAGAALGLAAVVAYRLSLSGGSTAYQNEIAFVGPKPFRLGEFLSQIWQFYLPKLGFMTDRLGPAYGARAVWVESFFGRFGSLEVRYPGNVYDALQALMIVLVLAVPTALVLLRRIVRWDAVIFLLTIVVVLMGFLHLASYRNLLGTDDPLIVGRYLLPFVAPIGIAIAFVLSLLPRRPMVYGATALLAGEAMLLLTGLGLTLERFYA